MLKYAYLFGGFALAGSLAYYLAHANPSPGQATAAQTQAAAAGKTIYLVFQRDNGPATQAVEQAVKTHADKHAARATWARVALTDPAEKALVDKYQLSRAPMPLVLAVHPNGAVTGYFQKPMTEAEFTDTLVSPAKAECMKRLQANQLVLLCVQASAQDAVPQGVQEFRADPQFSQRANVVTVQLSDPNEATFFTHLQIDPQTAAPQTVFMAPPGVMVGKFPPSASKSDLAKSLHKAGKCCDDKNCKHNH